MEENQNSKKPTEEPFFEDLVKKTKTGITFPKNLREALFEEDAEIFFKLVVPQEKDKIILEILSNDQNLQMMHLTLSISMLRNQIKAKSNSW